MRKPKPLPTVELPKRLCHVCATKLLNANFAGLGWVCMKDGCTGGPRQNPDAEPTAVKPRRRRAA
jgi:hypothetical protein